VPIQRRPNLAPTPTLLQNPTLIAVLVKRALANAHARVKTKTKELVP